MTKVESDTPPELPASWDLVRPSVGLLRENLDTLLWLVLVPAALGLLASQLLSNILVKYAPQLSGHPTDQELNAVFHKIAHELLHTTHGHVAVGLLIAGVLLQLLVVPATLNFMLRAAKGQPADIRSSLSGGFHYFWRTFGILLCCWVLVSIGLLLFIVPGLIFLRRYALAVFYGMDRQVGVFEAMRLSARDSVIYKGYIWGTIGVMIAFVFMAVIAGTVPVLGIVLSLVLDYLYFFGFALRYQSIVAAKKQLARSQK